MDDKEKRGYRYDKSSIQDYGMSKMYEVVSLKSGLKYLGSTTNSLENILHNYKLDKKRYDEGEGSWNEIFVILENDDVDIRLVSLEFCSGKRELDLICTKYLRNHRVEYINIMLYQRLANEFKSDIATGIEDNYVSRYKDLLSSDKFSKYMIQLECARKAKKPAALLECLAK
jgi:hypothetical protein